jgi:large subunit ribosomal protein L21
MYAVVETGGKQFRVAPGDSIRVETLPGEPGQAVTLEKVLALVTDDQQVRAGTEVAGAKVNATIEKHGRGEKIIVFKFKRKKQYRKTIGHRQNYTQLKVESISA